MKSFLIFLTILLLPFLLFAQQSGRVAIPGTRCTIIPPPYFLPATAFPGFTGEEAKASIAVIDYTASANGLLDTFKSGIERKNKTMKLQRHDTVLLGGKPFPLLQYSQRGESESFEKLILFLGNSENGLMVMASYPQEAGGLAAAIRQSILSAQIDEDLRVNPEAAAPFSVAGGTRGFQPTLYMNNTLTYSARENLYGSRGTFVVMSRSAVLTAEEKEAYLQQQLQKMGDTKIEVMSLKPVTIQYLTGYELRGRRRENSGTNTMHMTVLFQDDAGLVYTLVGTANARPKYWEKRFREMAESFKLK